MRSADRAVHTTRADDRAQHQAIDPRDGPWCECQHRDERDRETYGEEVRGGDSVERVLDQEERRATHSRHQQEGRRSQAGAHRQT
jgi:hypothetical protein